MYCASFLTAENAEVAELSSGFLCGLRALRGEKSFFRDNIILKRKGGKSMDLALLLQNTLAYLGHTLSVNWPFLTVSVLVAAVMRAYVDQNRVASFLQHNSGGGVVAATAVAVGTPLCSCGTMAIILGMMANLTPWAPIVAFMVASPLTSPEELFYSAGLFGWPFALTFFAASIVLGLIGGLVAHLLDSRGWLRDQARFQAAAAAQPARSLGAAAIASRTGWRVVLAEVGQTAPRLMAYFLVFATVGYWLNSLIPAEWMSALFSSGQLHSVPLAATLGLPLYVNTEASLPLIRSMLDAGMSPGAAMAFLIAGAGTSIGAVGGALTIARWRVVGLVIGTLWVGAVIFGFGYNAASAAGLF
jgi:uncharacterized membrane protein YraQ (UPF0718 family)